MNRESYKRSISVRVTPERAYTALTSGYSHWWTATDDVIETIGDRIAFRFPPNVSYWIFEATRLNPHRQLELTCVEAFHKITDKPNASESEWLGSRMIFNIESGKEQTLIHFHHEGLTPDLDCFEVCEAGWNHFFLHSLQRYLDTGLGKPHQMEQTG